MRAYKCDICGKLFEDRSGPILPVRPSSRQLIIAFDGTYLNAADICAGCLKILRDTVYDLSLVTEENNEPETSSSECKRWE